MFFDPTWVFCLVVYALLDRKPLQKDEKSFVALLIAFSVTTLLSPIPILQFIPFGIGVYLLAHNKTYESIHQAQTPTMRILFLIALILNLIQFAVVSILILFYAIGTTTTGFVLTRRISMKKKR